MPPRVPYAPATGREIIESLMEGQQRASLSKRRSMVRDLLTKALAEFRAQNVHADREHRLDSNKVDELVEELHEDVMQWLGAKYALKDIGDRLSERHRKLLLDGQCYAMESAREKAAELMVETRYDVEQLVARIHAPLPTDPYVPSALYGGLVHEME